MNTEFTWVCLLTDLPTRFDDSYDKWLSDTKVNHDNNNDNEVNEYDYELYLNSLYEQYIH